MAKDKRRVDHKGRYMTEQGAELPDPTPMDPPVGFTVQESMFDIVARQVHAALKAKAESEEFDSPEEDEDYDIEEDEDPVSPYEFDRIADLAEVERVRRALDVRERELSGNNDPGAGATSASGGGPLGTEAAGGSPSASGEAPAAGGLPKK